MTIMPEVMSQERFDKYTDEAARFAGYTEGFGVSGCDLSRNRYWVAYTRQSSREQAENDRLGEYYLTCAKLARQHSLVVPREYIIYDNDSSEDFNRPGMRYLRGKLIAGRRIEGVIIPAQGRLSMDPLHQLTFEKECQHYGVRIIYGDAPGGNDWGSRTTRLIQAQANALRVETNRKSALSGNISRIMVGKVPSQKPPYGYVYNSEKRIEPHTGKTRVLSAWWEINEPDSDGNPVNKSRAWAVNQMFHWIGTEGRTQYWTTDKLNELGVPPVYGNRWLPKMVNEIVKRHSYTGKGEYNVNERVPNPDKPLGDLTLGVKRTLLRPKPEGEKVYFDTPPLTSEELWKRANENLKERGRGRGKQGKKIQALFRARMMCPVCGKPMAIMLRKGKRVYYYCRDRYNKWQKQPCQYRSFVSGTWDNEIWLEIREMLSSDIWIEQRLTEELNSSKELDKLIRIHELKISNYENKIVRVEEGFEGGLYSLEDAKIKKRKYILVIEDVQSEISILRKQVESRITQDTLENLKHDLETLLNKNLGDTSFEDKLDLVAGLGIKVYPSEDLKSRRIKCGLDINSFQKTGEQTGCAKVVYGRPYRSRTCDTLIKSQICSLAWKVTANARRSLTSL